MIKYIFYKDEYMLSSLGVYSRKQKGLKAGLSCLPKGLGVSVASQLYDCALPSSDQDVSL